MDNLVRAIFSSGNPFLAKAFDFFQAGKLMFKRYSYTAEWNPLAALAVAASPSTTMTIDPQIDFLMLQMNFVAYPTTGDQNTAMATPNMLLQVTEKSGANVWADTDHHVAFWTGRQSGGNRAYDLPFPALLTGNNAISPKLTDLGGTASRCWLGFEGVRLTYVDCQRTDVFPGLLF